MFDNLQPGVVVKTSDGTGCIYRRDITTVIVMIPTETSLEAKMYRFADIEPIHCEFFDKICDNSKFLYPGYPACCDFCKFNSTLEKLDIDE